MKASEAAGFLSRSTAAAPSSRKYEKNLHSSDEAHRKVQRQEKYYIPWIASIQRECCISVPNAVLPAYILLGPTRNGQEYVHTIEYSEKLREAAARMTPNRIFRTVLHLCFLALPGAYAE
jgi:L-amino acid N-acyltransferase YncA